MGGKDKIRLGPLLVLHHDLTMIRERRDIGALAWEAVLTEENLAPGKGKGC